MKLIVFLVMAGFLKNTGVCVVVQKVVVPEPAVSGHPASLECWWSAGSGPPLYSLRWCKDGRQFFVVTLVPEYRKRVFSAPGVQVLVGASDQWRLSLTNVTSLTSGTYTCEAMSDAPHFFSSARSAYLSVVEVPADGPTWRGVLSVYHVDQQLHTDCHVYGSRPPATFSFFLNDHPVTDDNKWIIKQQPVKSTGELIWNSSSTLSIPLNSENIKILLPKSVPKLPSNSFQETQRNMAKYHSRPPKNLSPSVSSFYNPTLSFTTPKNSWQQSSSSASTITRSVRQLSYGSSYFISSTPPVLPSSRSSHIASRTVRYSFPPETFLINLTCVANIGGLSFKTSTWSSVSFPFPVHPNSISRFSGNSGTVSVPSLTLLVVLTLS
ncbi:uncharacterized protein [Panulirus ornatus]|uniref:uncharacterized protein n=1 Tax=Panulirus ornatus TaxID=150431 RepID=UPI003A845047